MIIADPVTERRLLAGMLTESKVLADADDIETDDFTDYRHWVVLGSIRQLQQESADVCPLEVERLLVLRDAQRDSFVSAQAGIMFLASLLFDAPPYRDESILWRHDIAWLRSLTRTRRALEAAA